MNYLSHFVIAEHEATPVTAAASLFPDMLTYGGASAPTHRVPKRSCRSPLWPEVRAGIAHHLHVDRAFHGSQWFTDRMRESAAWLRAADSPLLEHWSMWLLRHVAIELVLDGWLVREDATLAARVYEALGQIHADADVLDAIEGEYAAERTFRDYLGTFLERRWLHVYEEPEAVAHAIARVFELLLQRRPRIREANPGAVAFTDAEREAVVPFIVAVFDQVRAGGPPLVAGEARPMTGFVRATRSWEPDVLPATRA